jgi:AAA+ ATPase superfamily predicted ATPase
MDFPVMLRNLEEMMYEKTQIAYHFRGVEQFLDAFFLQDTFTTLVIDEFQNFEAVDKSIFSTFQKVVDKYRNKSQKKIVVLGSIQSMMIKIFENAREPLYKRATQSMMIKEFDVDTQIEILQDMFGKKYTHRILLDSYTLFSGIPYYLSSLESRHYQDYNLKRILQDLFFNDFALLRNEGKEILIEEFGQKYRRFFAILEAISTGKTRRNEIMQAV